jgi:integrase
VKARLTDKLINSLEPAERAYPVSDSVIGGFRLMVMPTGVMTFQLLYRNQDGRRQTFTIGKYGTITLTQARAVADRKSGEVKSGRDVHLEKKERRTQAEVARQRTLRVFFEERYKPYLLANRKSGARIAAQLEYDFIGPWGDRSLSGINAGLLASHQTKKIEQGLSDGAVNRPIAYLKGLMSRALEWGVIDSNPLSRFKQLREDRSGVVRYLSEGEASSLLDGLEVRQQRQRAERQRYIEWCMKRNKTAPEPCGYFTDHLKPLVLMALHTGMRRGELFNVRRSDLNLDRRIVTIHAKGAKSDKTRHIPINDLLNDVLVAWLGQTDADKDDLVFPSPVGGGRLDNIAKSWNNLIKDAGIDRFRFHDLRHTFASWLVMRGASLYTVKELLGHSTIEMTQRYAHLSPEHKFSAVALLCEPA